MDDNVEFSNELNELTAVWVPSESKVYLYGTGGDEQSVEVASVEKAEEVYWNFVYQF